MRIMLTDGRISGDAVVGYPYGGGSPDPSANGTQQTIDSSKVNEWQDISIIYTVPETVETARVVTNSGNTYTAYPSFAIRMTDDDTSTTSGTQYTYYIDDMKTVVLSSEAGISFGSRESGEDAYVLGTANALDGNVVAIEATASAASEGDVISIVDGETYSLVKAENGKLMFGDIVLCNDKGEEIVLGAKATKVVAIYDDNAGTVRFAVGNSLAYYKDGDMVKATFALPAIDGGVSENAKIIGADSVNVIKATSEIIGPQVHTDDFAVRFIAGVDSIYYTEVGFKLETAESSKVITDNVVYSSVKANGNTVKASDYGYNYLSAISLTAINTDGKIKITPVLKVGEHEILGQTVFYNVICGDGVIDISEISESEFGA